MVDTSKGETLAGMARKASSGGYARILASDPYKANFMSTSFECAFSSAIAKSSSRSCPPATSLK